MNLRLKFAGYTTPVSSITDPDAYKFMQYLNAVGAAIRVLMAHPSESLIYSGMPDDLTLAQTRRQALEREWAVGLRSLAEGRLPASQSLEARHKAFAGASKDDDGNSKLPVFTRGQWDAPGTRALTESS
jgi:hypothetical protein